MSKQTCKDCRFFEEECGSTRGVCCIDPPVLRESDGKMLAVFVYEDRTACMNIMEIED